MKKLKSRIRKVAKARVSVMSIQELDFPIGAIVISLLDIEGVTHNGVTFGGLKKGKYGLIISHTTDGRAIINFGTGVHTFEDTIGYVSTIGDHDYDFSDMLNKIAKELP
jgi:hypothetical protein